MLSNLKCCPYCGSISIKKNGYYKSIQKYRCQTYGSIFNERTNTIFSSSKLNNKTIHNLFLLLLDDSRLKVIQDLLNVSSRTAYFWRMKIYKLAGQLISKEKLR